MGDDSVNHPLDEHQLDYPSDTGPTATAPCSPLLRIVSPDLHLLCFPVIPFYEFLLPVPLNPLVS